MGHVRWQRREITSLSAINLVMGMWLVISPFILNYRSVAARWDQVVIGVLVMLMSSLRIAVPKLQLSSWVNGAAGIWIILAPFLLGYAKTIAYWNAIIIGVIVAVIALWNTTIYTEHYHNHRHPAM